ncbi:GIY-YIG nuclease family protein [Streptococcus henryi]|uniref:GIY-YIG nuclease family protein n=1 Tax=Streptococcus henryi TaxID=439219 RepID=UPI00036E65EC|nr:GIY-YIG nuclease family protein [Streptococcus henryi]
MTELFLSQVLKFDETILPKVKIRFHVWENSIDYTKSYYLSDKEQVNNWNIFYNPEGKNYFRVGEIVVNFIKIGYDKWLLTTVKEVTKKLDVNSGKSYEGTELREFSPYFDRLIIKFKPGISTVRYFERSADKIEVTELLAEPFTDDAFPGYDNIRLSYLQLESIFRLEKRDWLTALSNQKAVYLITDTKTGKLYVGSATSNNGMLLSRWADYTKNGHGGNKELRALIKENSFDYVKENFQYAVLENYNAKVDDHFVLSRESWWKEALQTRKFGYNDN